MRLCLQVGKIKEIRVANPLRLVLVRHGESEANTVQNAQKRGEVSPIEDAISTRADWKQRLSPKGREQARIAGKKLREIYGSLEFFDAHYVSPFIRTRETAVLISGQKQVKWRIDDRLSERIWGIYGAVSRAEQRSHFPLTAKLANDDPWYIRYDGGESLFDVYNRFKAFQSKLWRENSRQNVLIVAHKQLIQTACYDIEKLLPEDWDKIWENKKYDIPNCGAVEFSRVNPLDSRDIRENFSWRRFLDLGGGKIPSEFQNWEEIGGDKAFLTDELSSQIINYRPFMD